MIIKDFPSNALQYFTTSWNDNVDIITMRLIGMIAVMTYDASKTYFVLI